MLGSPHARVDNELELAVIQLEKGVETVGVDRSQQGKELNAVLWELGEILVDHLQSALKDVLHDVWNLVLHKAAKLANDDGKESKHLGITGVWNITVVVEEDGVQESWDKVSANHLQVIGSLNVGLEELEDFLLDGPKTSDLWSLGGNITTVCNGLRDHLARSSVHLKHIKVDLANLWEEVAADRCACRDVGLHDVADDLDGVAVLKDGWVGSCLLDDLLPSDIRIGHELGDESLLSVLLWLGGNHVTAGLVEGVDLLWRQVACDLAHGSDNLVNEWLLLSWLKCDKVTLALAGDLDECIASHILDTLVRFVHELEELVDDSLEELPVGLQETWILADDVHDVGRDDSLVVLASLHLSQAKQVFDHGNQETLLGLLVHGHGDGTNSPAEGVAVGPRPFASVDLFGKLLRHDVLGVDDIQMRQIHETLAGSLVELNRVTLLDELADNLSLVVLHN